MRQIKSGRLSLMRGWVVWLSRWDGLVFDRDGQRIWIHRAGHCMAYDHEGD